MKSLEQQNSPVVEAKAAEACERALIDVIPEQYRNFYRRDNKEGGFINTAYSEAVEMETCKAIIPRMILATSSEQIRLSDEPRYALPRYDDSYDDDGFPYTTYEYYSGLENYYVFFVNGKPVYLTDNHSHALFGWLEAKEARMLERNVVLLRFDDHFDMVPSRAIMEREKISREIRNGSIDIKNFTVPALESGLIHKVFFVHGLLKDSVQGAVKRSLERGKLSVSHEDDAVRRFAELGMFADLSARAAENPRSIVECVAEMKKEGLSVILDIDFDVFSRSEASPLLPILPELQRQSDICTCATSPYYFNQEKAIEIAKKFIDGCQLLEKTGLKGK